ncbi:helix-turn-helix transcriptional regulator [Rhizobium sp. RAF56]|uniref:helix-turn-helix transcriptional regulator n=1 Tax=Rhizobium sp. RAF56 TaxID=3233062 RepID=UPI003F9A96CB
MQKSNDELNNADVVVRRTEAMRITGHTSVPAFYDAMARGEVPRPIKVDRRAVGWLLSELLARQRRMIAERDAAIDAKLKARAKAEDTGKAATIVEDVTAKTSATKGKSRRQAA